MTEVTVRRRGERCALTLEGHATGQPAVCAALSALVCALAGYVGPRAVRVYQWELAPGRARLEFAGGAQCAAAWELVCEGLEQISRQWPETVLFREG